MKIYIQMNINGLLTDKLKKEYKKLVDKVMELQEEKKQIINRSLTVNELTANAGVAKTIFDRYEKNNFNIYVFDYMSYLFM